MRRLLLVTLVVLAAGAAALFASGAGEDKDSANAYTVELDNAFGLIEGGDVKVAGVRAGKISSMEIDRKTKKALIGIEINRPGFGSLRKDAFCESRPQSLIGEYFVDCAPGASRDPLPNHRVPLKQTGSTVPPDLVNNVLRLPYRERLRVIVHELGGAVAGRGDDLNEALKRASPALRETDRVLATLARQNRILRDLTENADEVLGDLSDNRRDVGRWVVEAGDTAEASAERRTELAATFRKLPDFLEELQPTMAALGDVATEQTPVFRDLRAMSGQLERFFGNLGPFAEASRPAFRSLGEASVTGREAVRAAGPTVAQLNEFSKDAPELGKNLAIVLEDLDDRGRAVQKKPRTPGGQGFTGLEALLDYVITQSLAINIFDGNAYALKVAPFESEACAPYTVAEGAKDPEKKHCFSVLGPNQPGVTTPDPTASGSPSRRASDSGERSKARGRRRSASNRGGGERGGNGGGGANGGPPPIDLQSTLEQIFGDRTPQTPAAEALTNLIGGASSTARDSRSTQLLDYILAP